MTVTAPGFRSWLAEAKLGDELVYHIGDLTADSDPISGPRAKSLNDLLDAVEAERRRGRVKLRQELLAKDRFQHLARRIS